MRWRKLGLLYCDERPNRHPKLQSHAANPLPILLHGDIYRVFYSARDNVNRSSVGAVDIDIVTRKIVQEHASPFFEFGPKGSFYADGVSIGNTYTVNGERYMLFMGWQAPKDSHWRGDIGRLIVKPDLTLELESDTPFMASNSEDPISLSYPWVLENIDGSFSMWYGSTIDWQTQNEEMLHVIKSASSTDGHVWTRNGLAIPYQLGKAQAFSRPTVIQNPEGVLEMWFSYRSGTGQKYRIGFAHSGNGNAWDLGLDQAQLEVSSHGWDSEMVEYPFVFKHKEHTYMLYNGNEYGKTGFGLAVLERI